MLDKNNPLVYNTNVLHIKEFLVILDPSILPYVSHVSTLSNSGYMRVMIRNHPFIPQKYHLAHRATWWNHTGEDPQGLVIHHKDGNRCNNLLSNLESQGISQHQREANQGKPKSNGPKLMGNRNARRFSDEEYSQIQSLKGIIPIDQIQSRYRISRTMVYKIWRKVGTQN